MVVKKYSLCFLAIFTLDVNCSNINHEMQIGSVDEVKLHFLMSREEYQGIFQSSGHAGLDIITYGYGEQLAKVFDRYNRVVPLIDIHDENMYVVVTRGDGKCFENSVCGNDVNYSYKGCNVAKSISYTKQNSIKMQIEDSLKKGVYIDQTVLQEVDGVYWPYAGSPHPLDLVNDSILGETLNTFPFKISVVDGDGYGRSYESNVNDDCTVYLYLKNYHFSRMITKKSLNELNKDDDVRFVVLNQQSNM